MATLNSIITQLGDALNRPIDSMLRARLKDLVIQTFSLFVSRSITSYGIDKEFVYSYYITELESVSTIEGITLARPYIITKNKIPRPLRYDTNCPFVYVGTVEGDIPFSYRNKHSRKYTSLLPNVGNVPSYDFHEDRIIIWNPPELFTGSEPPQPIPFTTILVQQVPFDPRVASHPDEFGEFIFDDDREFPITQDLVEQIKLTLLQGELSVTDSKDKIEATHLDNA